MNNLLWKCYFVSLILSLILPLRGDILIHEIGATSDARQIRWTDDDQPYVGAGLPWWEIEYDDSQWWSGESPIGVDRPGLGTDVESLIKGQTPSLYMRKGFNASAAQANSSTRLLLEIDFNDGFIAYLNGVEVARSHMGPVKGFAYADQSALTTRPSGEGRVDYDLGEAGELLVSGDNLLAIQVHNDSLTGDLLVNASLVFEGASDIITEGFDDSNNARRTHQRNGGSVSDTTQGNLPTGSWLDEAPNPSSSSAWSDLEIVTEMDSSIGSSGNGALRHTITSGNSLEIASVFSPPLDMNSEWTAGNVTMTNLANTTLSFAAQLPDDFSISVSVESADGTGPALTGFPDLVRPSSADLIGYWRFDDSGASDGGDMTGTENVLNPGVLDGTDRGSPLYSDDVPGPIIYDPITNTSKANNYSMGVSGADDRLTIANDSLLNTDSFTTEFFIKVLEEPGGYEAFAQRSEGSAGDSVSSARRRWKIDFDHGGSHFGKARGQWDTPGTPPLDFQRIIRGERVWVDTPTGDDNPASYADGDPASQGNGRNDDTAWHHVAMTYNGETKEARFYTDGVAGESLFLNGVFAHPNGVMQFGKFGPSYDLLIDEIRYTGRVLRPDEFLTTDATSSWQNYAIRLSDVALSTQNAFTDHLNASNLTDLRLVFTLQGNSYDSTGKSFVIDDFSLSSNGAGFSASLVGATTQWQYFPGLMEPSGGVFDRAMVEDPLVSNDFSDWIELHNNGSSTVDVGGWSLTDNASLPAKWVIPNNTDIPAGGYLLILADQLTSLSSPNYLHANFKLAGSGEYVGLFNASAQLQSEIAPKYPTQYTHCSYGRSPNDGTLGYLEMPTPGAANIGPALADRVDAPDFDMKGGFYDGPVTVTLTSQTVGASIRYTEDLTEPTLTNGIDYTGPITVTALSSSSGRVIRARAFLSGMIDSKSKSHTYLINQDSRLRSAPAMVFSADLPRSLYKPYGVLAIEGGQHVNDRWEPITADDYNHALFRGRAFERPVHLEYYFADGSVGFRTDAGVRFAGSNSVRPEIVLAHLDESPWRAEKREKPSFNVYFRDDYGNPEVSFPLNGDLYPVDRFKQLRMRAGKNDDHNPFILDEWVRRLYRQMGQVGSVGAINSLYVNGEFKGFYNTVERLREPFFNEHYGLPGSTDWDVLQAGNPDDLASGDRVAWENMIGLMNGTISESNWNTILGVADVESMADYFLINIYMGMWDWPTNNWVAARERSNNGRYRFCVWDAEGAIHRKGDKPIDYNTIEEDLNDGSSEPQACWQALMRWPEFRLIFADRINKHLFNNGVLDDRDFNNSTINATYDALENEFSDLLDYRLGETVDRDDLNDWVDPSDGRRTYLFGLAGQSREDFRDNDLWPVTEPVTFNQHGGSVASGFNLTISHNDGGDAEIYYTTDGTDPRAYGDAVSATAQSYPGGGITLNSASTHILARVRDPSGNWSPLTEATFLAGTVAPTSTNLVVAEMHYHPADAKNAEITVAPDKDDYEFIQLLNIGTSSVDLNGVRFDGSVEGIEFQFSGSAVTTLALGAYVIVVKNQVAFEARYGAGFNSMIAGEFEGRLSNAGEQITLRDGSAAIIQQFTYADDAPWPNLADGFGKSLLLSDPTSSPDHTNPAQWIASPVYHGTPGGVLPMDTLSTWQQTHFDAFQLADSSISGPLADPDGDGMTNLVEYGLGTLPLVAVAERISPTGMSVVSETDTYLGLTYRIATTASDLEHIVEVSDSPQNWNSDVVEVTSPVDHGDGSMTYRVRDSVPFADGDRRFMRVRFIQP